MVWVNQIFKNFKNAFLVLVVYVFSSDGRILQQSLGFVTPETDATERLIDQVVKATTKILSVLDIKIWCGTIITKWMERKSIHFPRCTFRKGFLWKWIYVLRQSFFLGQYIFLWLNFLFSLVGI